MKPKFAVGAFALCAFVATASAAQAHRGAADFCYLQCQYECYIQFPGGGEQWRQCYVACGATKCAAS